MPGIHTHGLQCYSRHRLGHCWKRGCVHAEDGSLGDTETGRHPSNCNLSASTVCLHADVTSRDIAGEGLLSHHNRLQQLIHVAICSGPAILTGKLEQSHGCFRRKLGDYVLH